MSQQENWQQNAQGGAGEPPSNSAGAQGQASSFGVGSASAYQQAYSAQGAAPYAAQPPYGAPNAAGTPGAAGAWSAAGAPSTAGAQSAAGAPGASDAGSTSAQQAPGAWAPGAVPASYAQASAQSSYQQPGYAGFGCASSAQPGTCAPAAGVPAPQPKKSRGWIVALVAVILFFALMFFGLASCNSMMSSLADPFGSLSDDLSGDYVTTNSVGVIEISGTIQYDGTTSSPEGLKAQLDRAEENPYIKAVVMRVDSGGGTATAGEEMAAYVRDFSKPVVVSCASMSASAAYEISSQADYIYTAKTSAVGAIGTVIQVTDLSGLFDKLGISVDNIASADSKDSSYGTRPLTEEERAYYQAMVDQINESFIETVASGRNMSTDEVRALATGLTFTGIDAVENGLADEVGTLEDAVAKASELAGFSYCDMVYLRPGSSDISDLLNLMSSSNSQSDLAGILREGAGNVGLER